MKLLLQHSFFQNLITIYERDYAISMKNFENKDFK